MERIILQLVGSCVEDGRSQISEIPHIRTKVPCLHSFVIKRQMCRISSEVVFRCPGQAGHDDEHTVVEEEDGRVGTEGPM